MTTTLVMSCRCPLVIPGAFGDYDARPVDRGKTWAKKRQTVTSGAASLVGANGDASARKSVAARSSVVRSPHAPQPKSGSRGRVVVLGVAERQDCRAGRPGRQLTRAAAAAMCTAARPSSVRRRQDLVAIDAPGDPAAFGEPMCLDEVARLIDQHHISATVLASRAATRSPSSSISLWVSDSDLTSSKGDRAPEASSAPSARSACTAVELNRRSSSRWLPS